jgi:hypothetical protein
MNMQDLLRALGYGAPLAALLIPIIAGAHHSFAIYDADNPTTLAGVVDEFRWTNPHSWLFLTVTNPDGSETRWEIEHGPINMLSRQGWTRTTLEPGDRIVVEVHPAHGGRQVGRFISMEFAGETDTAPPGSVSGATITFVPRPEPIEMSPEVARNFNGIWLNANGGLYFDTSAPSGREQQPPLRSEYLAQWHQRFAAADAGLSINDPTASCLPPGFPRFLSMVFPGEILQAEHQINWYAEWGESTVRIYLDGRTPPADLQPSYNGFTTGDWRADVLVTRTVGLRGDTLIDTTGIPHSDQLTVTMQLEKLTPDYLEVNVTLEDPVAFERPWSTVKRFVRAPPHYYIQEFACFEGNRYRVTDEGHVEVVSGEHVQP